MVTLTDDFVSDTVKVRSSGNQSMIVGLRKEVCEAAGIGKGDLIQIYCKVLKKGEPKQENENKESEIPADL